MSTINVSANESNPNMGKSGSSNLLSLFKHEIKANWRFVFYWIIGINAYFLLTVGIYPGEEAVKSFLGLFEEEIFQAFLGAVDGDAPAYRIWLSMMLPIIVVAMFIFALMLGVRLAVGAISDETGELIHTQPVTRLQVVFIRFIVGILSIILMMLVSTAFMFVPVEGEFIPVANIITFSWWGIYFLIASLSIGFFFGIIAADTGRGNMFSLLFSILLYALQAMGRIIPALEDIVDFIPLNWYNPGLAIMSNEVTDNVLLYITIMLIIGTVASNLVFLKRDLIKEAAIPIPLLTRFSRRGKSKKTGGKSDKDKLLTLWVRPIEKRLPFTADFIYSDRKALLITFWAIVIFYPAQLMAFNPNDQAFLDNLEATIATFGNNGVMKVFTYGHDLTHDLWLWFLITQAVGNHYFILLPLSAHWIKKILQSDAELMTGEILGSLPVDRTKVMLERLFGVLIMLLFTVFQMVFWLVLSKSVIGVESNTMWEIIAILSTIPLYIFLISGGLVLGLLVSSGVKYARFSLLGLVMWFIAGILLDGNSGVFGLYDPVLIITEQSLSVANYGVIWLSGLAAVFAVLIVRLASRYDFLDIPDADPSVISALNS